MKGDFTRSTFRPQKHYSSVRMQQGRLQVDADWNEQADITAYLREQQSRDFLGQNVAAAPRTERVGIQADPFENFRVSLSTNGGDFDTAAESESFYIAAGRIYVNGIWCELQNATSYFNQPDYPEAPKPNQDGQYLAYLDVWQRHITTVDDDFIRESALNSVPDTTTRLQTVCQVKLKPLAKNKPTLEDAIAALIPPQKGTLKARLKPASGLSNGSPSVDNTLYRVEIHKPGPLGTATFKWSKDNGIIVSRIVSIKDNTLTVESPEGFSPGSWVEVTDTYQELRGEPGLLLQLTEKTTGTRLVFDPSKTSDGDKNLIDAARFTSRKPNNILKVRRWDTNAIQTKSDATWIDLCNGVQINLPQADSSQSDSAQAEQTYATGDYWLIPVRSISPQLDYWPTDNNNEPAAIPPQGIQHNTAPLAFLSYANEKFKLAKTDRAESFPFGDFRLTFPALTRALDSFGGVIEGSLEIQQNLLVQGEAKLSTGVAINKFSNEKLSNSTQSLPTEGTVKTYVDTEVRNVDEKVRRANERIDAVENEVDLVKDRAGKLESDAEELTEKFQKEKEETVKRFEAVDVSISENRAATGSNSALIQRNTKAIGENSDRITSNTALTTDRTHANAVLIQENERLIESNKALITANKSLIDNNNNRLNPFFTDELPKVWRRIEAVEGEFDRLKVRVDAVAEIEGQQAQIESTLAETNEVIAQLRAAQTQTRDGLAETNTAFNELRDRQTQAQSNFVSQANLAQALLNKIDKGGSSEEDFRARSLQAESGIFSDTFSNTFSANQITARSISAQSIEQPSSQALKENISGLSSQEATILLSQLDPVKFSYRADQTQRIRTGFIAETVPDIVASADRQAISPLDVTAILAKMTKDHHLAIAQMTSLIQQQRQEISALSAKVERLSNGTII